MSACNADGIASQPPILPAENGRSISFACQRRVNLGQHSHAPPSTPRFANRVRHDRTAHPKRLFMTDGRILRRLMLYLGIQFCAY
jgi:hypothetical protein